MSNSISDSSMSSEISFLLSYQVGAIILAFVAHDIWWYVGWTIFSFIYILCPFCNIRSFINGILLGKNIGKCSKNKTNNGEC